MNENKANYAKIGFFVLSGFALLLLVIGVAGARVFSRQRVLAETYFTESVTGLDVGSPVKYRGVPVGEVSRVGFVFSEYGNPGATPASLEATSQILVIMALDPEKFSPLKGRDPADFLGRLVKDGIRVKVAASGITGLSYLELDYFPSHPKDRPMPVPWRPRNPYIPSTPSTMVAFKQAIDDVFVKLSQLNIQALGDELLATLYVVQNKLLGLDASGLSRDAGALLSELRASNRSLQSLLGAPELQRLPADLAAAAGNARRLTDSAAAQVDPLMASVRSAADRADRLAGSLAGVVTNAGAQVEQTASALSQTAQALNRTALTQQESLADLIASLGRAAANLDRLIAELRATPSALLFSQPPAPLPETGR